jgi:hypothetical protein
MNKIKLLISNLFLACVLFSCSKDPNTTQAASSIQYKVNGNSIEIDNTVIAKQKAPTVPNTRYLFNAQTGANNIVIFTILTDSLKKVTYHYDSTALGLGASNVINYNGQTSAVLSKNDYFDITITDYSGGHVSGTFAAKLTPVSSTGTIGTPSSVSVTEGKLNNVQVVY